MNKSRSHILIVDDDHITLDLLMEVLSREGYEVSIAFSGEETILRAQETYFDVVITDIRMGNKDGMEVLRTFKRISPETIIIMITAFGAIDTAIEAIREGAFDYITKPFKLEEIALTVIKSFRTKEID